MINEKLERAERKIAELESTIKGKDISIKEYLQTIERLKNDLFKSKNSLDEALWFVKKGYEIDEHITDCQECKNSEINCMKIDDEIQDFFDKRDAFLVEEGILPDPNETY